MPVWEFSLKLTTSCPIALQKILHSKKLILLIEVEVWFPSLNAFANNGVRKVEIKVIYQSLKLNFHDEVIFN